MHFLFSILCCMPSDKSALPDIPIDKSNIFMFKNV